MRQINNADVDIRDRELVITRIYDAPVKLVYKLWTDPQHVSQWWGPKTYTIPVCEIDLRPGGEYLYVMRSPKGDDFPVKGKFINIVPNERVVYTDDMFENVDFWRHMLGGKVGDDVDFTTIQSIITVTFEKVENKTRLTLTTRFVSNEVRDAMIGMQMAEGWTQSLEKLAEELKKS
jgi:uncharacterized protein YndB with AHSA1/START domain